MPNVASRISVPRDLPETQAVSSGYSTKPVTNIDAAKKRAAARVAVICNKDISPRARLLYVLLDDWAGMKGVTWYRQKVMAKAMSATRQTVNEWITELAGAGIITIDARRAHYAVYVLAWAGDVGGTRHHEENDEKSCRDSPTGDVGDGRHLEAIYLLTEPNQEPAPTVAQPCARCAGHGWLAYSFHSREGRKTNARLCGCMPLEEAGGWGRGDKLLRKQLLVRVG